MSRTRFLMGVLILAAMVSWVITFFYYSRLPLRIPANFNFDGSFTLGERWTFFVSPVVSTLGAIFALIVYPFRRRLINFPGKRRVLALPNEFSEPIFQRAYQIVVMVVIFATIVLSFVQANVAFIATGRTNAFNIMPFYGVLAIFAVYVVYSAFNLSRMAKAAEDYHSEWKERGGDE